VLRDAPLALGRMGRGGRPNGGRLELCRETGEMADELVPPGVGRGGTWIGGQPGTRALAPDP